MDSTDSPDPRHRTDDAGGGNTLDLRQAWPPRTVTSHRPPWYQTPAAEVHVQTRGRWMIYSGITVGALTFLFAIAWRQLSDGRVMPIEYMLPLYAIAFGAISIGIVEYLNRGARYQHHLALDQNRATEQGMFALAELMDEQLKQKWFQVYAAIKKDQLLTGTENARPHGRVVRNGEVLDFRQKRNDSAR